MLILTWNIAKSERALELALTYLARAAVSETVLACLQELPDPFSLRLDPARLAAEGLDAAAPALAGRRVLFVHSANLACVASWNVAQDRMQIVRWRLGSGTEFLAAGIHAPDLRNYAVLEVRGAYAALTRAALDQCWGDSTPLLMLGDFNAWPDCPEMYERACLFGVSSRYEHRPAHDIFFGRRSPPIYLVEPNAAGPLGTYFDAGKSLWRDLDHIYVSAPLRSTARAQRLDSMGQMRLVTAHGRPRAAQFSDHLPVEAHINLA